MAFFWGPLPDILTQSRRSLKLTYLARQRGRTHHFFWVHCVPIQVLAVPL